MATIVTVNETTPGRQIANEAIGSTNHGSAGTFVSYVTALGGHAQGLGIPNYVKRVQAGELLPHHYWSKQKPQEVDVTPGTWYIEEASNPSSWAKWENSLFGLPLSYSPPDPNLSQTDYALQKAAAEIYSQGWDALTFGAELPKTANMIRNFQKKAVNLSRGLSKKKIYDAWLEARYGWRTLGYDVRDIHHAVVEMETRRDIWSERQGFSHDRQLTDSWIYNSYPNLKGLITQSGFISESVRGSVSARISVSRARFNPLETGWELVPFSFILDWVYDVGTAIRAMSFLATSTDYYASVGYKQTYRSKYEGSLDSVYPTKANGIFSRAIEWSGERVERTPTKLSFKPQVTNRLATPDLILDLTALSRLRRRLSSRR